jgi:sugar lactone lactonase YvrE
MAKRVVQTLIFLIVVLLAYFLFWPTPIDPVAWNAPPNPGYEGPYERNVKLKGIETLPLGGKTGPEDVALDAKGYIYAATHDGTIVRLDPDGSNPQNWANTGGRPLGVDFDNEGNLIVADAYRGLLSIDPSAGVSLLTDAAQGKPIKYADDVDVAKDGKIYFSDASTRFGAKESGGTMEGSLLEIMEHGKTGRLLVYDPEKKTTQTLLENISFANGVCVGHNQEFVLVNETGEYRILRYWVSGPKKGETDVFMDGLPSFPDNISTGADGRFWVALISPRNPLVDRLADRPFLRKVIQRAPSFLRPKAKSYGHIIAVNREARVVLDLQDPKTGYPQNTSAIETEDYIYIGSLITPALARIKKSEIGL